jgi:hypothetical protein
LAGEGVAAPGDWVAAASDSGAAEVIAGGGFFSNLEIGRRSGSNGAYRHQREIAPCGGCIIPIRPGPDNKINLVPAILIGQTR